MKIPQLWDPGCQKMGQLFYKITKTPVEYQSKGNLKNLNTMDNFWKCQNVRTPGPKTRNQKLEKIVKIQPGSDKGKFSPNPNVAFI